MVFSFEHVMADYGASKFDLRPLDLRKLKAIFTRWQEGLADAGWNSLYWDKPRSAARGVRGSATTACTASAPPSCSPRRSTSSAALPTCTRARSSG
jgi:hypothetical protein